MADYSWPPMEERRVIGKRISRLDGIAKSTGKAKYASDLNMSGLVYGALLTCPHAHAKVKSIDESEAKAMKGVTGFYVVSKPGTEIQWAGTEVIAVAAETEQIARDAVRKIKVEYEVLPYLVREDNLAKVGKYGKPAGEQVTGDLDQGFQQAAATVEGQYGCPVITHCCLEPHGQVIEWKGDSMNYWPSTQYVSGLAGDLAKSLEGISPDKIKVEMDYMGGGFGSKFSSDIWGTICAYLSKNSGGRPVKLFLDRATEVTTAGVRPSHFAKIKVGAKQDGTLVAWSSESWSSGGVGGGGMAPIPYVFTEIPNRRLNHTAVSLNAGPQRAWRAPNHPQASFLTCSALDDLAAKLNMDPLDLFLKNVELTARPEIYRSQLLKAAELIEWKQNWKPRGTNANGVMRRGLGIGINTWAGAGHDSKANAIIRPDGSVEIEIGTQDLGSGTRTIIAMVAAETYGLPISMVKVKIGRNSYPDSSASGGSTTVGGVSSATRKATVSALAKLMEAVAPTLNSTPDKLEAVDGTIRVKGDPSKSMPWKQACSKLGVTVVQERGENNRRSPGGLNTAGASGIQMADVSVDIETGVVKVNKVVAVQDCGLVINPKTAESQVYGALIMSCCAALMEERVMDQQLGRVLNADMEFYKLAGINDIGELTVYMDIRPEFDKKGVVGLGEPPAVGGMAAIANAVANAIGVRVPMVPLTPMRVLDALERSKA